MPKECVKKDKIIIEGKEAHHILKVMRMKEGDKVIVFDGTGCEYMGFITETEKNNEKVLVKVVRKETPPEESVPEVTLAQAIPKRKKMDYIVEKATELGVSRIVPILTERTIVRPHDNQAAKTKAERWRKIALEASKQCGRIKVPVVDEISLYVEMTGRLDEYDLVLMACLDNERVTLKEAVRDFGKGKILVFIGPEGDFTNEEIIMAAKDNCKFVTLGTRVLKSDTAGLFVLSSLAYELGI